VNENTKDLEKIRSAGDESTSIKERALRKKERLYHKIEYFDDIEIIYVAIEFCLEKEI
jgi:methenyltetrahydromethanopterin cyclohydrolase